MGEVTAGGGGSGPPDERARVSDGGDPAAAGDIAAAGDAARAGDALRAARLAIFDFDGPITRLLPDPEYQELAAAAVALVADAGIAVPAEVATLTDHGAVIVEVGGRWPHLLGRVEALSEAAEVAAAGRRDPARGALELLRALYAAGTPVALVSNNGAACIHAFLDRIGVAAHRPGEDPRTGAGSGGPRWARGAPSRPSGPSGLVVRGVYGRTAGRADRLKPSPAMLLDAAADAAVPPDQAVMVGDSVTDIVAAARAGIPGIGLTPLPQRAQAMREAGAIAVLDDTAALFAAYSARR